MTDIRVNAGMWNKVSADAKKTILEVLHTHFKRQRLTVVPDAEKANVSYGTIECCNECRSQADTAIKACEKLTGENMWACKIAVWGAMETCLEHCTGTEPP
jgi:hypothetical protein